MFMDRLSRALVFLCLLCGSFVLVTLVACGGGGGGGGGGVQTTPIQVTLHWDARSRAVTAPSSALSVVVTIANAAVGGTDFTFTINRNAAPAAYDQTYTSTGSARVGTWSVTARFYAQPDGGGDVVGIAQANVQIQSNGTGIGTILTTGTVISVTVGPGQSVLVGQTKDLLFTARDLSNNIVAVTPGSAFFTVTAGANQLQIQNGQAVGVLPGTATVTASVDNHVSAAQTVQVTSNTVVDVAPPTVSLAPAAAQTFTATVTNAPDTAVTWSIQEGAAGGTITAGGVYTAPNTAGTYHVVATSQYDPTKSDTATVTVHMGVTVTPPTATLTLRQTQIFTATVTGTANTAVTWSIQEGAAGGTITVGGVYTAPALSGTFHVVATSVADTSQTAVSTVTVQSGSANGMID
jgi:hypothetical protein